MKRMSMSSDTSLARTRGRKCAKVKSRSARHSAQSLGAAVRVSLSVIVVLSNLASPTISVRAQERQPALVVKINETGSCEVAGEPIDCNVVGARLLSECPDGNCEVIVVPHRKSTYEPTAAAMKSLWSSGFKKVSFPSGPAK